MKRVAVIGAGPGGLVAAKTLLHSHPPNTFSVKVFEKSDRIGGLWNVKNRPKNGFLPSDMPTNLSKYTVGFSDLSWDSLRFEDRSAPTFPRAWQVEEYLEEYAKRYLPKEAISFRTEVKVADKIVEHSRTGWKVKYSIEGRQDLSEETFDYLLVATGFFNEPRPIQCGLDGFEQGSSPVKLVHSSKYRDLGDILPSGKQEGNKKILIVGGANSGGEAAAAVAFDLSSSRHSPGGDRDLNYQIHHVTPRPVYGLPLFVPGDAPGTFVPLDMKLYDLSKRPEGPISFAFGKQPPEMSRFVHGLMQSILGTDEHEVGFQLPVSNVAADLAAPYAAIQEHYAGFARSGNIVPVVGRVTSLSQSDDGQTLTGHIEGSTGGTTITDIAGVVYATGYTPHTALNFLPDPVKEALEYDPTNLRLPLLLHDDMVSSNPAEPSLGFIGFYEGPYWGVMEMQARLLAQKWANSSSDSESNSTEAQAGSKKRASTLREVRSAMHSAKERVPQYVFSDYLAILEQSSRDLNLSRNDNGWSPREGQVTSARYLAPGNDRAEAQKTMASLQRTVRASQETGLYAPRATFRALQGDWKLNRRLSSARPEFPSGTFMGTASFYPRRPTSPAFDLEYLYVERGTLVTEQGARMEAHRAYVWRYQEEGDEVSVWFVKADGEGRGMAVEYR